MVAVLLQQEIGLFDLWSPVETVLADVLLPVRFPKLGVTSLLPGAGVESFDVWNVVRLGLCELVVPILVGMTLGSGLPIDEANLGWLFLPGRLDWGCYRRQGGLHCHYYLCPEAVEDMFELSSVVPVVTSVALEGLRWPHKGGCHPRLSLRTVVRLGFEVRRPAPC